MSRKEKYWSKRKRYGYGWVPTSWQTWTATGVWLLLIFLGLMIVDESVPNSVWIYLCVVFLSMIPLILFTYKTGPKPKWRWGWKDGDNPEEDF